MISARLTIMAAVAIAALTLAAPHAAHAQGGKPAAKPRIPLDDDSLGKIGNALKKHCPDEYGALTPGQRRKVAASMKRYVDLVIGFYIEADGNPCHKEIAAALKNFCNEKKGTTIVIDFGAKGTVRVRPDGDAKPTSKDEIRITSKIFKAFAKDFLKAANSSVPDRSLPIPPFATPGAYRFITALMTEALRIKHTTKIPGATDHTALRFKNHVEVLRRRIDIYKDLKQELKDLIDDPFLFNSDGKYKINRRIIEQILRVEDDAARKRLAEKWLKLICNKALDPAEKQLLADWTKFKKKFGLAPGLGLDQIDEAIDVLIETRQEPVNFEEWRDPVKKTAHFVVPGGFIDDDTTHAYIGGGGTFLVGGDDTETVGTTAITQVAADTAEAELLEVEGLDHVYHAHLADGGATLFVAGGKIETGDGIILAYADPDGDGFFDPTTRTETVRDAEVFGGAFFLDDPATGATLIFTRNQQSIFQLAFSGAAPHEFPDILEPRGSLGFRRNDLEFAELSDDGLTAVGYGDRFDDPPTPDTALPYALTEVPGGEFIPVNDDYRPFADDAREPAFAALPVENAEFFAAFAPPGVRVTALINRGGEEFAVGNATADAAGDLIIPLAGPPLPGDTVRLLDAEGDLSSAAVPVIALDTPPSFPHLPAITDNGVIVYLEGVPGTAPALDSSVDLVDWFPVPAPALDETGSAALLLPTENPATHYRLGKSER